MVTLSSGEFISNHDFYDWIRYDQSIRSWVFATLSYEVLVDVCDCPTSFYLWERLNKWFLHSCIGRALKHMLTAICKSKSQSMDAYLHDIKSIVDYLALVNSPVPQSDLMDYTLMGLVGSIIWSLPSLVFL